MGMQIVRMQNGHGNNFSHAKNGKEKNQDKQNPF